MPSAERHPWQQHWKQTSSSLTPHSLNAHRRPARPPGRQARTTKSRAFQQQQASNRPLLLGVIRDGNEYEWSLEMFGYVEWACCVNYDIHGKTLTIYHTQGVFELTLDDGACGLADAMGALAV